MRLFLLSRGYPTPENPYSIGYVHRRAVLYRRAGHDVSAGVIEGTAAVSRPHEGIPVTRGPQAAVAEALDAARPDAVLVHLFDRHMAPLLAARPRVPVVVWIHGFEALAWYRRLFDFQATPAWAKGVALNFLQRYVLRRLVRRSDGSPWVRFVFVSRWMQDIAEWDLGASTRHRHVIPNPVDTDLFVPAPKGPEMRTRVLLVRPFSSRKYAVDVAVRVIVELSRRPRFGELQFALHGDGPRFESLTAPLRGFPNVALRRGFLPQPELPGLYREHGVFLCPTRQDAQGVSMCEAMASGLVPVSTGVTAIPEFIRHGENGLLSRGVGPMADHIEALARDPGLFARLSAEAARSMREQCGGDQVAAQELEVVAEAVRHAPGTAVSAVAVSP